MERTELAKLCGVSRQQIHNCIKEGMSEVDILLKYTVPIKGERVEEKKPKTRISKDRFKEGYQVGYDIGFDEGYKTNQKMIVAAEKSVKKNQKVKELIKKIVYKYQLSTNKEIEFADINEIYEMVKEY